MFGNPNELERWAMSNQNVVEYNNAIMALTGSNQAIYPLFNSSAAKSMIYYLIKYMVKDTCELTHCLSTVIESYKKIQQTPSIAKDTGTKDRNAKHLLMSIVNKITSKMEVSSMLAASVIMGYPSFICSHDFILIFPWAAKKHVDETLIVGERVADDSDCSISDNEVDNHYDLNDPFIDNNETENEIRCIIDQHHDEEEENEEDNDINSYCGTESTSSPENSRTGSYNSISYDDDSNFNNSITDDNIDNNCNGDNCEELFIPKSLNDDYYEEDGFVCNDDYIDDKIQDDNDYYPNKSNKKVKLKHLKRNRNYITLDDEDKELIAENKTLKFDEAESKNSTEENLLLFDSYDISYSCINTQELNVNNMENIHEIKKEFSTVYDNNTTDDYYSLINEFANDYCDHQISEQKSHEDFLLNLQNFDVISEKELLLNNGTVVVKNDLIDEGYKESMYNNQESTEINQGAGKIYILF
jgi:hypothetical protein